MLPSSAQGFFIFFSLSSEKWKSSKAPVTDQKMMHERRASWKSHHFFQLWKMRGRKIDETFTTLTFVHHFQCFPPHLIALEKCEERRKTPVGRRKFLGRGKKLIFFPQGFFFSPHISPKQWVRRGALKVMHKGERRESLIDFSPPHFSKLEKTMRFSRRSPLCIIFWSVTGALLLFHFSEDREKRMKKPCVQQSLLEEISEFLGGKEGSRLLFWYNRHFSPFRCFLTQ